MRFQIPSLLRDGIAPLSCVFPASRGRRHPPSSRKPPAPPPVPIATFTDIAEKAGLTAQNIFGGIDTKKYIIETTGTGVAIFDYDNDGWPDIFLVNGTRLEGFPAGQGSHQPPLSQQSRRHLHRRHRKSRS